MTNVILQNLPSVNSLQNSNQILVNAGGNPRKASFTGILDPTSAVYVNSFFDGINFTAPSCTLQPLSKWFSTLAAAQVSYPYATSLRQTLAAQPLLAKYKTLVAAQVDYPDATSLADEVSWCCWTRAIRTIYERYLAADPGSTVNLSTGKIVADGAYTVNQTVHNYLNTLEVVGVAFNFTADGMRNAGETALQIIGAPGTVDVPVFAFDSWAMDEFGQPPAGKLPMPADERQNIRFYNVKLAGNYARPASSINVAEYKCGFRSRMGGWVKLSDVCISGTLWDGIVLVAPQVAIVNRIDGGLCWRDSVAVQDLVVSRPITNITRANPAVVTYTGTNFLANGEQIKIIGVVGMREVDSSVYTVANLNTDAKTFELQGVDSSGFAAYSSGGTAAKTYDTDFILLHSEFGYNGRCAALLDLTSANKKRVRFDTNSFESVDGDSYIQAHPTWYPLGCSTEICLIACSDIVDIASRFEGSSLNGIWGNLLYIGCNGITVRDGTIRNPIFATKSASVPYTSAARTYIAAYGRMDISDQRNYNAGATGDQGTQCDNIVISKSFAMGLFNEVDGPCLGPGPHLFEDLQFSHWSIPTTTGSFGKIVADWTSAIPSYLPVPPNAVFRNVSGPGAELRAFDNYSSVTDSGSYRINSALQAPAWTATKAYFATFDQRAKSTNFLALRQLVAPTVFNGYVFQCVQSGTSAGSEPTWPSTIGQTVTDGSVIWKCIATTWASTENQLKEFRRNGQRQRFASAIPSEGLWPVGAIVWNRGPAAGGSSPMGWVCTTAGLAGSTAVFKAFGSDIAP